MFFCKCFRLIFNFYFSPCWCTPRGRLLNKSSSSSSTPAPRWVTVASRPRRTKWPSWDPSRRTLPRPKLQPKIFPKSAFVNIFFKPTRKNKYFVKKKFLFVFSRFLIDFWHFRDIFRVSTIFLFTEQN